MYISQAGQQNPTKTTITLKGIPNGRAGTLTVLKAMRDLARKGKTNPVVFDLSRSIVKNVPPKNWEKEVQTLYEWVRDNIRYIKDPHNIETLHTPEKILEYGQGDCDDQSILLATLLEITGHPARFVAVGFRPGSFSHVYVETKIGNNWVSLDPIMEKWVMGQRAPGIKSKMRVGI